MDVDNLVVVAVEPENNSGVLLSLDALKHS